MREAWSIIVHGGAKTIKPEREAAHRAGCLAAVIAGQAVLEAGGSAVSAVVTAIRVLENDPTFNAGYGCVLNSDGEVELDAAIMDGSTLDVGAVAAMQGVCNPIEAAHALLTDQAVFLVGSGASRFAAEKGLNLCEPDAHRSSIPGEEACNTVGCVAYDRQGRLAAGTSTGGLEGTRPGRVGDAPIPGCGLYAEDNLGGVSFSGDGESILRLALAGRVMADLEVSNAAQAADHAISLMPRVGGEAGCILIDGSGNIGFAHNSSHFAVAIAAADRPARAMLQRSEYDDE
jgi:isoaspartyl peptidase/L-asparaginase-like protein (Ntn-hydrolase superfamily)